MRKRTIRRKIAKTTKAMNAFNTNLTRTEAELKAHRENLAEIKATLERVKAEIEAYKVN